MQVLWGPLKIQPRMQPHVGQHCTIVNSNIEVLWCGKYIYADISTMPKLLTATIYYLKMFVVNVLTSRRKVQLATSIKLFGYSIFDIRYRFAVNVNIIHWDWPPWLFLYQPPPKPNVPSQLHTHSPYTKMSLSPLSHYLTQFSRRENVCGVDWVHLVWVGVGIKKARGVNPNVLYWRLQRIYSEYRISNIQTTWYWSASLGGRALDLVCYRYYTNAIGMLLWTLLGLIVIHSDWDVSGVTWLETELASRSL